MTGVLKHEATSENGTSIPCAQGGSFMRPFPKGGLGLDFV